MTELRFPIAKDRFVIGRGKQSSDLTLKDPNVSRQHAMIEFQNGIYSWSTWARRTASNTTDSASRGSKSSRVTSFDCHHDIAFTYA